MATTGGEVMVLQAEALRRFCTAAFRQALMWEEDAALLAETLVEADLRGVHSHGVMLLPRYVRGLKVGGVNPRPEVKVVVETAAVALVDGDNGMGQMASVKAMELAIEKARRLGVGAVGVRNSNHFGAAAYYAMLALPHDMVGFATTNAPAVMAPWGGVTPTVGNNPFAYAMPAGRERPLVLDMACSTSARGKIRLAAQKGERIPLGWALTKEGEPTEDPHEALAGLLAPVGGYKGYGLAVIIEALAGVLTGALFARDIPRAGLESSEVFYPYHVGHFFGALDIGCFLSIAEYKARMDRLIGQIRSTALAKGVDRVYLPGEIEFEHHERRLREGIPTSYAVVRELKRLAEELGLEPSFS